MFIDFISIVQTPNYSETKKIIANCYIYINDPHNFFENVGEAITCYFIYDKTIAWLTLSNLKKSLLFR